MKSHPWLAICAAGSAGQLFLIGTERGREEIPCWGNNEDVYQFVTESARHAVIDHQR